MALAAEDLLYPKGPVTTTLFPDKTDDEVKLYLTAYLDEAYADSRVTAVSDTEKKDKKARAWALYRTFDDVAIRMDAEPIGVNEGSEHGTTTYSVDQITKMEERAASYLEQFNDIVATQQGGRPSTAVRNIFGW